LHLSSVFDSHHDQLALDVRQGWWVVPAAIGAFHVYICRRCGFAELYVPDIASVPIESLKDAELLVGRPPGEK
jgi:hypothetical protein